MNGRELLIMIETKMCRTKNVIKFHRGKIKCRRQQTAALLYYRRAEKINNNLITDAKKIKLFDWITKPHMRKDYN